MKGMRLLTPRGHAQEAQHIQQQEAQQTQPKPHHERLADSTLARRIIESDSNAAFLDVSSASAPPPPPAQPRRVAWADDAVTPSERHTASPTQAPHIAAAIGMIVAPSTSDDTGSTFHGALVVTDVVAHGPAAAAGVAPGDAITHVDGHHVTNSDEVAQLVAGPEGSCLQIHGLRHGKVVTFSVTRRAMWIAPPSIQPTPTFAASTAVPFITSRATSPIYFPSELSSDAAVLKSSLHEACVAWQEDVRLIHRHYEALLAPLCEHVKVDPVSAAVVAVRNCNDLSSLADLLKVTRMAQNAVSGPDDEFIAKYLALAEAPAPEFAWNLFSDASHSSNQLDPTSQDVQRVLKTMNQKLRTAQLQCSMWQSKCEMIPTLQSAFESERAEVQRLDDVISKFRSAVSFGCLPSSLCVFVRSNDSLTAGVNRAGSIPQSSRRLRPAVESSQIRARTVT